MNKALKQFTLATIFYAIAMTVYMGSVETNAIDMNLQSGNYIAQGLK